MAEFLADLIVQHMAGEKMTAPEMGDRLRQLSADGTIDLVIEDEAGLPLRIHTAIVFDDRFERGFRKRRRGNTIWTEWRIEG